jgi:hypothetical protein
MRKKSSLEMIYQVNLRSNVLDLICITLATSSKAFYCQPNTIKFYGAFKTNPLSLKLPSDETLMKIKCTSFEPFVATFHGTFLQSLPPDVYCLAVTHPIIHLINRLLTANR